MYDLSVSSNWSHGNGVAKNFEIDIFFRPYNYIKCPQKFTVLLIFNFFSAAKRYNFSNIRCINPLPVTTESINFGTEFCQREPTFVTNLKCMMVVLAFNFHHLNRYIHAFEIGQCWVKLLISHTGDFFLLLVFYVSQYPKTLGKVQWTC